MPLTYNENTATGSTVAGSNLGTDFPIYFPYLAKSHINVDFNKVLQSQSNFVVYDANEAVTPAGAFGASTAFIRFTTGFPSAGTTVRVRRITEKAFPLVDFQDGSALTADDQDLAFLQNFYLNQESVEQADNALGKVGLVFYANSIRITEIGQPTDPNDATTKTYVDTRDALKVSKAGDTMSGALAMGNNKITGLGTPTASADATTKTYVDTADATKVSKAGDTMSGALAMGNNKITGLGTPTANEDAATKSYVDSGDSTLTTNKVSKSGDTMSGALAMGNNKITGLGTPTATTDAATKAYADTKLSLTGGFVTGDIDMGGTNRVVDLPDPITLDHAANKAYVDGAIAQYVNTGGISSQPTRWIFTGDGTTVTFNITGATALFTTCYSVALDGVTQDPTFSFNVNINNTTQTITFAQAPASGVRIVVIATGYAVPTIASVPNNIVGTLALVDDSVTAAKLRDSTTTDSDRAVTTDHIRDLAVSTAKIAGNAVTDVKLSSDATVDANRAVNTNHIKDLAVSTAKIAGSAVTDAKLASSTTADINRAVGTDHIKDLAVSSAKIANNAVNSTKLASDATLDGNRAVTTNHIKDLAVTNAKLAGGITAAKLENSGVTSGTYGSTTVAPQITVNAQGLVTSVSNQTIAFPTQKVLNVWQNVKSDHFISTAFTGTHPNPTWQDITGFAGLSFTLTSATSKLLILGNFQLGCGNQNVYLRLVRSGAVISYAATTMVRNSNAATASISSVSNQSARPLATTGYNNSNETAANSAQTLMPVSFSFIDTPGVTNPTYSVQIGGWSGAIGYVNRSASNYNATLATHYGISTLTFMEIS